MSTELKHIYLHNAHCKTLLENIEQGKKENHISGISGAAISFLISAVTHQTKKFQLVIAPDKEKAAYLLNDLEALVDKEEVMFLPESYRRAYDTEETDNANVLMRTEALNAISQNKASIVVTYPNAICEKVMTILEIQNRKLTLKAGENVDYDFILDVLIEYDFDRDDFVYEPGQFAARGGIIDVFSFAHNLPIRIEFNGNKVESIRSFNPDTQLSVNNFEAIDILPNIERKDKNEIRQSLLEFIPENSIVWVYDEKQIQEVLNHFYKKAEDNFEKLSGEIKRTDPKDLFLTETDFKTQINKFSSIYWGPQQENTKSILFNTGGQPPFQKNFDLLLDDLTNKKNEFYTSYIFTDQVKQMERIFSIFDELLKKKGILDGANSPWLFEPASAVGLNQHIFAPHFFSIHEGFVDHDLKIACYTDHQIFERYKRFSLKASFSKEQSITIKEGSLPCFVCL